MLNASQPLYRADFSVASDDAFDPSLRGDVCSGQGHSGLARICTAVRCVAPSLSFAETRQVGTPDRVSCASGSVRRPLPPKSIRTNIEQTNATRSRAVLNVGAVFSTPCTLRVRPVVKCLFCCSGASVAPVRPMQARRHSQVSRWENLTNCKQRPQTQDNSCNRTSVSLHANCVARPV